MLELTRRLRARDGLQADSPRPATADAGDPIPSRSEGEVAAEAYLSAERFAAEQQAIFTRVPLVAGVAAELAAPGACLTVDAPGLAALAVRGEDGAVRGFKNACRHRGTRLVDDVACQRKAFVCPYHGWTYDLAGALVHVPHADSFRDSRPMEGPRAHLAPAPVAERHGLLWAGGDGDLAGFLAPIEEDLAALDAGTHVLYRRTEREVRGNWKLVIDAFLDGYHIRHLHRNTVYPFFADAMSEAERAGPHVRAVTARRALFEADDAALVADLRNVATPSYLLFPNTILIVHPDYLSVLVATPLAPARTRFVHWMLIPRAPATPEEEAHWAKSFALIDDRVFVAEDLRIVEAMQRGLESGANRALLFGRHEHAALWFHQAVDRYLA